MGRSGAFALRIFLPRGDDSHFSSSVTNGATIQNLCATKPGRQQYAYFKCITTDGLNATTVQPLALSGVLFAHMSVIETDCSVSRYSLFGIWAYRHERAANLLSSCALCGSVAMSCHPMSLISFLVFGANSVSVETPTTMYSLAKSRPSGCEQRSLHLQIHIGTTKEKALETIDLLQPCTSL